MKIVTGKNEVFLRMNKTAINAMLVCSRSALECAVKKIESLEAGEEVSKEDLTYIRESIERIINENDGYFKIAERANDLSELIINRSIGF